MAYDDFIKGASNDFGVPFDIIKSVVQVESGGNPYATGAAGEQGLMQIMPATGRDLGLANPFDPESNIRAGAKYLAQQYRTSGNWRDALGKYNAGKYYQGSQAQDYIKKVDAVYKGATGNSIDGGSGHEYIAENGDSISSGSGAVGGGGSQPEGDTGGDKPWYEKLIDYILELLKGGALKIAIGLIAVLFIVLGIWKLVKS